MRGKVMYCAMPTRLRHLREDVRKIARGGGYSPVIPFDIGAYEDFEGNPAIGRERTLKFMIHVMRFCDTVGVFGISPGVMGELKAALDYGQDVRVFYGLDPDWEEQYEILKRTEGDLLARLRGPNHLIVLVGPSAVGKTFWSDRLLELFPEWLTRVKTNTTRQPRNAADHASYNFISREEFEHGIKENRFLLWYNLRCYAFFEPAEK